MAEIYLDFEKPISELQKKIDELEKLSQGSQIDVSDELKALTAKLTKMTKDIYTHLSPWQRIQLSRHPERPYTLDYVAHLFSEFTELSGDRRFGDDHAVVGGFALFRGEPIMVIGTQKGRDMKSNVYRNFGWPSPEGYRKAMRLMHLADKANVPVVTFIDTPGAYPGVASEERHIAEAIAVNLRDMFSLRIPIVSVIIGEGGSGGAIGLGVGNRLLVMENAYYSVITPEGCAAILWKDRKFAPQAADALQLTADRLLELGVADQIIKEPFGGAHRDCAKAAEFIGKALHTNLAALRKLSGEKLREQRYEKFRSIGYFQTKDPAKRGKTATAAAASGNAE
ncbi:MAG: acetyl-CoA carboxylase carboxyltransferase subunit alpha [Lentisphaeria bacterium]|nr:acetyl-CoA carboxylase carboxyltransferase subunit alpha [Lentisphaeria bacterium]